MKLFQTIILRLLSAGLLIAAGALVAFPISELYRMAIEQAGKPNPLLRIAIGLAVAAVAIFGLLPFNLFRRGGKTISFTGQQGNVVIHLDSIEASLRRTLMRASLIKRVNVSINPTDNNRKVHVKAEVSLKKPADVGTRETTERLCEFIDKAARRIIGANEVTTVDVHVLNVDIDPKQTADSLEDFAITGGDEILATLPTGHTPTKSEVPSYSPSESAALKSETRSYSPPASLASESTTTSSFERPSYSAFESAAPPDDEDEPASNLDRGASSSLMTYEESVASNPQDTADDFEEETPETQPDSDPDPTPVDTSFQVLNDDEEKKEDTDPDNQPPRY